MRRIVEVVEQDEYIAWLKEQKSYYSSNVKGTAQDTYKGVLSDKETEEETKENITKENTEATDNKLSEAI